MRMPRRAQRAQRGRAVRVGEEAQRGQQRVERRRRAPDSGRRHRLRAAQRAGRAATRRRGPRAGARGSRRSRPGSRPSRPPRRRRCPCARAARRAGAAPAARTSSSVPRASNRIALGCARHAAADTGIDVGTWINAGAVDPGRVRARDAARPRVPRRARRARRPSAAGISREGATRLRFVRRLLYAAILLIGVAIALSGFTGISKLATQPARLGRDRRGDHRLRRPPDAGELRRRDHARDHAADPGRRLGDVRGQLRRRRGRAASTTRSCARRPSSGS